MKPIPEFLDRPKSFWASVRTLSQAIGYSRDNGIIVPSVREMAGAFGTLGLNAGVLLDRGTPTPLANDLQAYFAARARLLTDHVRPNLMDVHAAKSLFEEMRARSSPRCPIPMNKQKGDKRAEAYFTGIINMLIEMHSDGVPCNFDPRELTTITRNGEPLRTLARRVDGAFPSTVNPVAIWEIKEYYYTTSFGSRVADGVYESLLDGVELQELREHEQVHVQHALMVDAYLTWWGMGKAYLCRIIDMLHMGYVDDVLFGREVVTELPSLVASWVELERRRGQPGLPENAGPVA